MAYIGHRCKCGHLDVHHKLATATGKEKCEALAGVSCGKRCQKPTESVLVPTFDSKGRPVESITTPGARIGDGGYSRPTCACGGCQALYAELTAPA